jgi:hypothetical protein
MRNSQVSSNQDNAGPYEIELFDAANPKGVIVCAHGNGVRRWDGQKFFYAVAEHYADYAVLLVDQNQPAGDGSKLNPLNTMVARVQGITDLALSKYPGVPVIVMGHSMGCGIAARLNLEGVSRALFVTPTAGDEIRKLMQRYGPGILQGMEVTTSDGLLKIIPKEYIASVEGIVWENEYRKLLEHYSAVHVFEAGDEEIVGDERLAHRDMPFASYTTIPGAHHNLSGKPLQAFFTQADPLV